MWIAIDFTSNAKTISIQLELTEKITLRLRLLIFRMELSLARYSKCRYAQEKKSGVIISWEEFNTIFCKNCGNFRIFVKGIWNWFKRNFQYQLENEQD